MKSLSWKILLFALSASVFTGCSDDDDDVPAQTARAIVVHASPNAPAVDVRVNNSIALSNVPFPTASAYNTLPAGNTNIKISPTGTTNYVIDANVNLAANSNYSIFAIDSVSKIKAAVVGDNLTAPAAGKAHVRFFHFSPNAPGVDIAVTGGPVLFGGRTFNDQAANAALTAFTPVDAGTYNLEARLAGTSTVALPVPNVVLQAGKIYTVFARGFAGGSGAQALNAQVIVHN